MFIPMIAHQRFFFSSGELGCCGPDNQDDASDAQLQKLFPPAITLNSASESSLYLTSCMIVLPLFLIDK